MAEFEWNFHSRPEFSITESNFYRLGELDRDSWRRAMDLSEFSKIFSEVICDYNDRLGVFLH